MAFISQVSRQHRKPLDRSISEHKHEDHRFPEDFLFYKGQNLRKENINSYHQGTYVSSADNSVIINLSRLTHASCSSFIIRFITHRNGLRPRERFED